MNRLLIALALGLLLAGCRWVPVRAQPVPAQCEPTGFEVCKSAARWESDPSDPNAWDGLAETLADSRDETRTCEVRRKALEQCLKRLERAKLIILP